MANKPPAPEFQWSKVTVPPGLSKEKQEQHIDSLNYGPRTRQQLDVEQKQKLFGGSPWDPDYDDQIETMDLKRYGFDEKLEVLQVHRLLVPVLEAALEEVRAFCLRTKYRIHEIGGFCFRYIRNDPTNYIRDSADLRRDAMAWWSTLPENKPPRKGLVNPKWNDAYNIVAAYYERAKRTLKQGLISNHAWGSAVDINWSTNGLHSLVFDMPTELVEIMRRHGFDWGGFFHSNSIDPMHFEYQLDTIESRRVFFPFGAANGSQQPPAAQHPPAYYALNESGEGAGYYPVTVSRCLHGGAHFEPPDARTPVTALLPGYIVAARFIPPRTAGDTDVLREFLDQRLPGFVLLRHELEDPKNAGNPPIVLYSLYMHLEPPDWNAPQSNPAPGPARSAKSDKNAPDSAAAASWVQTFLRLRHGAVVNLDSSLDGGTALGKTYWSAAKITGQETEFEVIGHAVLPAGPKAVTKVAPAPVTKAIGAFRQGSVVTFSKPVLQVGMGEVLGFVRSMPGIRPGSALTRKDLHFEIFSPAGANGIAALVGKMPAGIQSVIQKVGEPGGTASANNYLETNEISPILTKFASSEAGTGMPPEGDSSHPPRVNTTEKDELQKMFSDPDYEVPLKHFMHTGTFALRNGATNNDLKPKSGAVDEPGYWLKLSLDNPYKFSGRADNKPIVVRVTFFCSEKKVEGVLEIADTNKQDYTILVPARADRMTLDSDDVSFQEVPLKKPDDARLELFKALVPLHWRGLQLSHINEWTADGLDRLLTELNQKEPTRIAHLLNLLDQSGPHGLPELEQALRPLSWWNRQCTANDQFGEVPAIGGDPSDSLFGTAANQLPPTGAIENIHPVTGAWICDLALRQNIVTARAKWDLASLERAQTSTTPVFLSFVGVDAGVAVGQIVPAVLVLEGYGTYEGCSLTLTRTDASGSPPIVFDKLQVREGTATIAPRFSMWGTWELSAKDQGGTALSPQKTPCLSLSATKPSPAGTLRIFKSPVDDSFWAWAPFEDKPPLALEGFLALQYVKTSGGEPAPGATWDYAKVAVPLVALHGHEATTTLGGVTIENGFAVKAEKNARISKSFSFADYAKKAKVKTAFKVSHALCLRLEQFRTFLDLPLTVQSVSADGLEVVATLDKPTDANKKKLKAKADSSDFPAQASIIHAVDERKGKITFTQAAADLRELFLEFRPRFAIGKLITDLSLQPSDELYVRPCFLAINGGHHGVDLTPLSNADGPAIAFDRNALLSRCNQDFVELAGTLVFGPLKATGVERMTFKMSDTRVRVEAKLAGDLKQWEKAKAKIKLEVTGKPPRQDGTIGHGVLSADWTIAPGGTSDPGRWGKQLNVSVLLGNPGAFQTPPQLLSASFNAVPSLDTFEVTRGEGKRLDLKGKAHCVPPTKDLIIRCDKWVDGSWVRAPEVEASIKYQNPAGKRPGGLCDENGDFVAFVPEASLDIPFDDTQRTWRFTWKRELTDGKIFGTTVAEKVFPNAFAGEASSGAGAGASHLAADDDDEILPHDIPPSVSYKKWPTATAS